MDEWSSDRSVPVTTQRSWLPLISSTGWRNPWLRLAFSPIPITTSSSPIRTAALRGRGFRNQPGRLYLGLRDRPRDGLKRAGTVRHNPAVRDAPAGWRIRVIGAPERPR